MLIRYSLVWRDAVIDQATLVITAAEDPPPEILIPFLAVDDDRNQDNDPLYDQLPKGAHIDEIQTVADDPDYNGSENRAADSAHSASHRHTPEHACRYCIQFVTDPN
jgi:hypothetical protein